ncbi:MAG: YbhB/YbcL family Raf kinase inhibitor-like protein [Gemmatimonadaceae bacterium]
MKLRIAGATVFALLGLSAAVASAQQAPPAMEAGALQLALVNLPARSSEKLVVTSPAFSMLGDIPFENTSWRANIFPGLAWTAGPAGTKSYVVIMEDGDALSKGVPILHWTMVNIPASITHLDAGMTAPPEGAVNGPNIRGPAHAYMGPRTPPGPKHRYHMQVLALDTTIPGGSQNSYADLIASMKRHVLASGELIGLGQAPPADSAK